MLGYCETTACPPRPTRSQSVKLEVGALCDYRRPRRHDVLLRTSPPRAPSPIGATLEVDMRPGDGTRAAAAALNGVELNDLHPPMWGSSFSADVEVLAVAADLKILDDGSELTMCASLRLRRRTPGAGQRHR